MSVNICALVACAYLHAGIAAQNSALKPCLWTCTSLGHVCTGAPEAWGAGGGDASDYSNEDDYEDGHDDGDGDDGEEVSHPPSSSPKLT